RSLAQEPAVARWLLTWQGTQFAGGGQAAEMLLPMVLPQFASTPSTFPAFIGLTSDLHATLRADTQRLPELKTFDRPVHIIFGAGDPYLKSRGGSTLPRSISHFRAIPAPERTLAAVRWS